jgi:hypothetical protein
MPEPGYVYFAQMHAPPSSPTGNILVKVGKSEDPAQRVKAFVGYPWPVQLLHVIQTDDMGWLEAHLHGLFACWRLEGVWFHLPPGVIDYYRMVQRIDRPAEPSLFPGEVVADDEVASRAHRTLFDA